MKHQREGACVHDTEVPELGRTATTPAETRVRASLRGPQLGAKRSPARVASRKHRGNQSHAHRTHQRTPGTSGVQLASARTARPSRSAPLRTELCRRGPKRGPTNTAPPRPERSRQRPLSRRGLGLGPSPGRADASTRRGKSRRWDSSQQLHTHNYTQEPQNNSAEWKKPDQKNTQREKCHLYKAPERQTHL